MIPKLRYAGMAGVLTAIGLLAEFVFFTISGYSQAPFNDPATALTFLRDHSMYLRLAVLFGAAGVAFRTVYIAGLAAKLHTAAPTRAVATLYFGIVGGVGHGLVALSFYAGIPALMALATRDQAAATNSWGAFTAITSGFQGFGNFLLGLALLTAGWAIIAHKALPVVLGWVGIVASATTLVGVFATGTSLAGLAFATFFPSVILAFVFDLWAGIALWKGAEGV